MAGGGSSSPGLAHNQRSSGCDARPRNHLAAAELQAWICACACLGAIMLGTILGLVDILDGARCR